MTVRSFIVHTTMSGALIFAGAGVVGAVTGETAPAPKDEPKVTATEHTERRAPGQLDYPEYEEYQDTGSDASDANREATAREETEREQTRDGLAEQVDKVTTKPTESPNKSKEDEDNRKKIKAEDGSYVNPDFYDRTDYNANGITDQDEPGWNNGAGEDAFKAEGAEKQRQWCEQNPTDRNCV